MSTPVSGIRNLGPASDAAFAKAGIRSADELRALGADEAYRRLLEAGSKPHFIGYYALVMGLQGRPWNDATTVEKTALRKRFDTIKSGSAAAPPSGIEAALNRIGVIPKADGQPASSRPEKK